MADRVLFIGWGTPTPGREERGLEVFNEAMGMYGRMQQEGRIESFDVVFLTPGSGLDGFIELRGSSEQLSAIRDDDEFTRNLIAADLITSGLRVVEGYCGEGVARQVAMYQEVLSSVPQTT